MFHPEGPTLLELAEQALTSTTRGYDLLASKFDYTPFRTPDFLLNPLVAEAAREPFARALDMCCGTGAAMSALRPHATAEVVGVDLSEGMLAQAAQNLDAAPGDTPYRLIQGDALTVTHPEPFDLITCCGAFGHILPPDQDRFLAGVRAALSPNGRFLFITAPTPSPARPVWWLARGFNAAMHVRNALLSPPFIMFYLTFPLERALTLLTRHGFSAEVLAPYADSPYPSARLVVARP